jgi:hypothetical protein
MPRLLIKPRIIVVWVPCLTLQKELFDRLVLLMDFGQDKKKNWLGILPLKNVRKFEKSHHIRVCFHLMSF